MITYEYMESHMTALRNEITLNQLTAKASKESPGTYITVWSVFGITSERQ